MVVRLFILKHLLIVLFGIETKWWLRQGSATTKLCYHRLSIALFEIETKWWLRQGSATTKFCHHRLSIALYLKYTCRICQYDKDQTAATHTISSMEVQLDRRMRA